MSFSRFLKFSNGHAKNLIGPSPDGRDFIIMTLIKVTDLMNLYPGCWTGGTYKGELPRKIGYSIFGIK